MLMDQAVLALAFSTDSELLATGAQNGKIWVWKVSTGTIVRRFNAAHSHGVTALCMTRDSSMIVSGSFDQIVRWVFPRCSQCLMTSRLILAIFSLECTV